MHKIYRGGYMNFLRSYDLFAPLCFSNAPYEIKECFYHEAHDIAMLVFSSFKNTQETINTLIKQTGNYSPPRNKTEKLKKLSSALCKISVTLDTKNIIVAPNYILRKGNLVPQNDMKTTVCDIPEEDYIDHIILFIKHELKLFTFKCHFITAFEPYHVTILINLLLSPYSDAFVDNIFSSRSGKWALTKKNKSTFNFLNLSSKYSFTILRNKHQEYIVDDTSTIEVGAALDTSVKLNALEVLHSVFVQCFSSTIIECEILSSISIIKSMPDCFMNAISDVNIVELKKRAIHLFGLDDRSIFGDGLFYETLALSMESLHKFLRVTSYLGDLPAPQFAHSQSRFDRCFDHETNLYINIGKMIALALYDKYAFCPKIVSTKIIKALFIFTKKDLEIPEEISYQILKRIIDWSDTDALHIYRSKINYRSVISLRKMTKERRRKLSEVLFLIFPDILYKAAFNKCIVDEETVRINENVITKILLDQKDILAKHPEQVILVMQKLMQCNHLGDPSDLNDLIDYLSKRQFRNEKLFNDNFKKAKKLVMNAINNVYITFIEPLFLIAWGTYLYSKMQYQSLGDKKNSSSNQLHAYISMVGKYDHFFDAIDLRSLPFCLKELKNEENIFDVLGDPFDSRVISKIEETISGFHAYETLSASDIDKIIITTSDSPIVKQKRDWICEYLKQASSKERKWFFKFATNIPYADPREISIFVMGSTLFSNSKIIYSNSCINTLMVGSSYHIEDLGHHFFKEIKDIEDVFPTINGFEKVRESFLLDLQESLFSYKNFAKSKISEITVNTSSGPFIRPCKKAPR